MRCAAAAAAARRALLAMAALAVQAEGFIPGGSVVQAPHVHVVSGGGEHRRGKRAPVMAAPGAAGEAARSILVTGASSGIGLALCKQLVIEEGCRVFLGSRDPAKGAAAIASMGLPEEAAARVSVVQIDVGSDESVEAAAAAVKELLGGSPLYALVNNAGAGLNTALSSANVLNTNWYGTKRACDAFLPLLDPAAGRIVNVGSGSGGIYVRGLGQTDEARLLMKGEATFEEIDAYVRANSGSGAADYGLSKAAVAAYTQHLARAHPGILSSCVSPGFIDTAMTRGYGAGTKPEGGTRSIRHCLFAELDGNGWYYGSDALRSPYHLMRNPGQPPYDGVMPF